MAQEGFHSAPLTGGDGPSSDHRPPWTPAVRRSPLRRGAHHAALQRAAALLRHVGRGAAGQTRHSAADAAAAALPSTGSDCGVANWLVRWLSVCRTAVCPLVNAQAQTWCDDGAYLLANQLVDKLQSKEEAQDALRDIERFLEGAPSTLNSGTDVLTMEYEAVITPQLQVGTNIVCYQVNISLF